MVYDGARDVKATVAGKLGAEAEVAVFAVGDGKLVEVPYLLKERLPVERRGGARSEDVPGSSNCPLSSSPCPRR